MDFVLVDDSVIEAYTDRVSRIVRSFGHLQDKMNDILSNVFGDDYAEINQSATAETMDYSEPAANMDYSEPVVDMGYEKSPTQFNEMSQSTESMESVIDNSFNQSFNEPIQEPVQQSSQVSDLDIDIDAMLEGITFDDDDLQL